MRFVLQSEHLFDYFATQVLTPEVRKIFVAKQVKGDGNCFWRASSYGLWHDDRYWLQLKLVVLAFAAANARELVGEWRHLFRKTIYYSAKVFQERSHGQWQICGGDDGL